MRKYEDMSYIESKIKALKQESLDVNNRVSALIDKINAGSATDENTTAEQVFEEFQELTFARAKILGALEVYEDLYGPEVPENKEDFII